MRMLITGVLLVALTACSTAVKIDDPSKQARLANIHYRLGVDALGKQGMLPKAFQELMRSNDILPDQPQVLDALAYAWLLRGDMKKSETFYLRAIRHDAGAATYNNYANLLNRQKRFPAAEKAARQALDDPSYPHQDLAFINLGDALLGQNRFDTAIHAYQQAQVFNPGSALVSLKLANAYTMHGKLREARALYEVLVREQQDNRSAVEGLVVVLKQQHDSASARDILTRFSQHTSVALDKAWAQNELDRLDKRSPQ